MIWAMPVREDQARASACHYDGTVAHDGQLDEETVAEPMRLADIGRKLLLVAGRELGALLEVFLTAGLFELVVAEQGALFVSASVACVRCAEHRRDTPISRGVTLEEPFLTGRRLV
jgi:hydroxymethylpyrimidine pyrophosphatase-like HAD family hydrolase